MVTALIFINIFTVHSENTIDQELAQEFGIFLT